MFTTVNGIKEVTQTIKTEIPKEFLTPGTISWKIVELRNRNYDAIIGHNLLEPLEATINLKHKYIEVKNNKIFFVQSIIILLI